jgi:serine/threonine protein kinase
MERLAAALADRYRIIREVGSGGMATVYLADDLRHGRQVALKVLRPELAATMGPERFFREIQVAARLQHPHILPLHDSGEADGFLYFVMPYVTGESLRERLDRLGELPVSDAVRILTQVADALSYSHSQGVVHRDIKPDNVMLSSRHAMVMDFGVAKAVHEAAGQSTVTTAGVALGTPTYMAPEQATADPQLDHRVDIYALGVVGYEMLTGRPPFSGMSPQQVLVAHVTEAPDPVRKFREACPPELEAVIMRCLAKRAADRWQSADELMHALEPLGVSSGGMTPTQSRPLSASHVPAEVPERSGNRGRTVAIAGVALAAVAVSLGAWLSSSADSGPTVIPASSLQRTQVTSTGDALEGALSPDGQRVVLVERVCGPTGSCVSDVKVQDVGGAGSTTLLSGLSFAGGVDWTEDGRWVILSATIGGRFGAYSVPSLGGTPRFLGCCSPTVGTGDTIVVSGMDDVSDRGTTVRLVTVSDGVTRDSVVLADTSALVAVAWTVPGRDRIVLGTLRDQRFTAMLADRNGRVLDTMAVEQPARGAAAILMREHGFVFADFPTGGRGVRVSWYRWDGPDRFGRQPQRVVEGLEVNAGIHISRDGSLTLSHGPIEQSVWALERPSTRSVNFTQRLLGRSTSGITGSIAADGDRVLLARTSPSDPAVSELAIAPFGGGAESSLGSLRDASDWDFHQDGRSILFARRQGQAQELIETDSRSGQTRILGPQAADAYLHETVAGGGFVFLTGRRDVNVRGVQVRGDTVFRSLGRLTAVMNLEPSPAGDAVVVSGWNESVDSIIVARLDLRSGVVTELTTLSGEGVDAVTWLPDGTLVLPVFETQYGLAWYLLPPDARSATRLGLAPRANATYRFSRNGLRAVAREGVVRPDIYVLRGSGIIPAP